MKIYIPTRGRFDYNVKPLIPLRYLSAFWVNSTYIVVHPDEAVEYADTLAMLVGEGDIVGNPRLLIINYTGGIAEKRTLIGQHAKEHGYEHFMMMDDDINFLKRLSDDSPAQQTIKDRDDTDDMLDDVLKSLVIYPQVALGLREGNNHAGNGPRPLPTECTKAIRAVAYWTDVFVSVDTNRVWTMSDYDTTLQILEAGYKNVVLNWWMSGQKGTNTPGGCSIWRNNALHEQSVKRMVELHPGIVRPRLKENKTGGEFGTRMELTIGWKKAYSGD